MNAMPYRLNQAQAQQYVGILHHEKFNKWVKENGIQPTFIGNRKLFIVKDLEAACEAEKEKQIALLNRKIYQ